jgi:predicted secreted protein
MTTTNLTANDPDAPNGPRIPVTVDWRDVPVTRVDLSRVDVEGNSQALQATVEFGPLASFPPSATDFDVEVDIETADHLVRIREGLPISSRADLQKEIQKAWEIASSSGGIGQISSVEVRTIVR